MPARPVPPPAAARPSPAPPTPLHRALGEAVRARRRALGLSQEALGEKARIDQTYLSNLENGRRNVSLALLVRLAQALDVPLSRLLAQAEALLHTGQDTGA